MRILFMGGHELGKVTLEYLINSGKNICGVVVTDTQDTWYSGVDQIAIKYNIELFRVADINNINFLNKIRKLNPDLITVVNFEQILKKDIIDIPSKGCINVHASLLPKYRGRAPLNWAMINGEKETGVTVHYIEAGIDTGDIILQTKIEIKDNYYIGDLLEKVKQIYPIIVKKAVDEIESKKVIRSKQDLKLGFYCKKRLPEDGKINWNKPSDEIYNLIRSLSEPYPGARTYYKDQKVIIWRAEMEDIFIEQKSELSGTILKFEKNKILIKSEPRNILITKYEINGDIKFIAGELLSF